MMKLRGAMHLPPPRQIKRCLAERTPKDPSRYTNIEDLRRELEQSTGQPAFTITKTINWLSQAANNTGGDGGTLAFSAYRWVLGLDQNLTTGWRGPPRDLAGAALVEIEERVDPAALGQLQALLLLPRAATLRLMYRCPALIRMPVGEVMARLVALKEILPGSNPARMVELVPSAFLAGGDWPGTLVQVRKAAEVLMGGLEGADVDAMFDEDPTILFEEVTSLEVGVRRMKELWDVGPQTLANSDPKELALAVRALGLNGPPKSY